MRLAWLLGLCFCLLGSGYAIEAKASDYPVSFDITVNGRSGTALERDVKLWIAPTRRNESFKDLEIMTLQGPGQLMLPEGPYTVVANLGWARLEQRFVVGGPTRHLVPMEVGFAELQLIPKLGAKPLNDDVRWTIKTWKWGTKGRHRAELLTLTGGRPVIMLPRGWYLVEVTHGGKTTRHSIEIDPGEPLLYTILKAK